MLIDEVAVDRGAIALTAGASVSLVVDLDLAATVTARGVGVALATTVRGDGGEAADFVSRTEGFGVAFATVFEAVILVGAGDGSAFFCAAGAGALAVAATGVDEGFAAGATTGSRGASLVTPERKPIFGGAAGAGAGVGADFAAGLAGTREFSHWSRFSASDGTAAAPDGVELAMDAATTNTAVPRICRK